MDHRNAKNVPKMSKRHQKCIDFIKVFDSLCHGIFGNKLKKLDN